MTVEGTAVELKGVCGACGETAVAIIDGKGMDPLTGPQPGQWMEPDGAGYIAKRKKGKGKKIRTLGAVAGHILKPGKKDALDDSYGEEIAMEDGSFPIADETDLQSAIALHGKAANPAAVKKHIKKRAAALGQTGMLPDSWKSADFYEKMLEDTDVKTLDENLEDEDVSLEEMGEFAENFFGAKMLDSGFEENTFVVQMEQKDGRVFEAFFDAEAQFKGMFFLDPEQKADYVVSSEDAKALALKTIEGEFVDVQPGVFENDDAWQVGITGKDGNFYDVFVSTSGTYLGHDTYETTSKSDESEEEKTAKKKPVEGSAAEEATETAAQEAAEDDGSGDNAETPAVEAAELEADKKRKKEDEVVVENTSAVLDAEFMKSLAEFEVIALETV